MVETLDRGGSLTARAFLLMFAKGAAYVLGFALPLLLVRRMSREEFGLYKQVFLAVSTALTVLPLGFGMSAYYFLPREPEARRGAVVLNIVVFNAAVGALFFLALLLRPSILAALFGSPELTAYAPLVGLVVMLWMMAGFVEIAAIACNESRLATVFIVAAQLSKTALLVSAAAGFGSVRSLVYAALAQGVFQTCVLLAYLRSRFPGFWRAPDWALMRAQLSYAMPIGFAGLVFGVLIDMHNYVVSHRFGAEAFAIYAIGCFSLPLVNIVGESFGSLLIPHISRLQKQGETREIVLVTAQTMRKLACVYFPLYAFLLVAGREFLVVLFTEQYLASWPIFVVHLTTLPTFVLITDPIMRAYAEHRFFLLKVRTVTVLLLFPALWFGTQRFGMVGAISIMVAFSLADRFVETAKAWSIVGVRWRDAALLKDFWKVAAASALSGGAAALVRGGAMAGGARPSVVLAASGLSFGAVYVVAMALFGVVTPGERDAVRRHLGALGRRVPGRRAPNIPVQEVKS
ncbi:MAG TPA: oligosaccharide flippase family protein [Pyrinomonadaceae bacterium]